MKEEILGELFNNPHKHKKAYYFPASNRDLQLFRLSKDVIYCFETGKQVSKIFSDMVDAGVSDPPFSEFAIEISSSCMAEFYAKFVIGVDEVTPKQAELWGQIDKLLFEYVVIKKAEVGMPPMYQATGYAWYRNGMRIPIFRKGQTAEDEEFVRILLERVNTFLIVLLATKNIEKTTKFHKDISKGKLSKATKYRERYSYTTTLTIGKITENYDGSEFTGVSRRPHLRRGHVRTQHYGPRNELTKKIFVPSVFVNGSEDIKSNRVAYNVSFAA
jgi:hypothetical protein